MFYYPHAFMIYMYIAKQEYLYELLVVYTYYVLIIIMILANISDSDKTLNFVCASNSPLYVIRRTLSCHSTCAHDFLYACTLA